MYPPHRLCFSLGVKGRALKAKSKTTYPTAASKSVLGRLLSKQGEPFDPRLVEQDMYMLFTTGYFDDVRIERVDTDQCIHLAVYVREKATRGGR